MKRALSFLAVGALVALTACGEAVQDGPVGHIDDEPTDVRQLPDQFPNIAALCLNGDRIYATTRDYNSIVVIEGGCNE